MGNYRNYVGFRYMYMTENNFMNFILGISMTCKRYSPKLQDMLLIQWLSWVLPLIIWPFYIS